MDNPGGGSIIQYVPFKSFVDPSFWPRLSELKLEVDGLRETSRQLHGQFCFRDDVGPVFEVSGTSFNSEAKPDNFYEDVTGTILNKNTIEDFKNIDKAALLNSVGEVIWSGIKDGAWISKPKLLLQFFILSFADLKKFHYYYWFAFPCPSQPTVHLTRQTSVSEHFDVDQQSALAQGHKSLHISQQCFFVVRKADDITVEPLSQVLSIDEQGQVILRCDLEGIMFGFLDPSITENPGWSLRGFLAALASCPGLTGVDIPVLGLRYSAGGGVGKSQIYTVKIPQAADGGWLGWERNEKGNFGPRLANMSASMDPIKLSDAAADLNVRLMKWRLVPELDVGAMAACRCLLLGAGTLGCHVARGLLAWGFRHITLVDSGRVSHSNPPRQSLYAHADVGRDKAPAAAAALKLVLPGANTSGISLHIPSPGHPAGAAGAAAAAAAARALAAAVAAHHAVFLLLDSREARWLPTVIGAAAGKIVINAALGFDSYLVMRHGTRPQPGDTSPADTQPPGAHARHAQPGDSCVPGSQLGCYFCNDVTAPGNSQSDRTLDQQCTVSRPGAAAAAAALAVEMLVGLLQHPLRADAPAFLDLPSTDAGGGAGAGAGGGVLGPVPHSVRGFLHSYQTMLPTCMRFKQCIACSDIVLESYRAEGEQFVLRVTDGVRHLERLTGLEALQLGAELTDILALSDDEED